GLKAAAVVELDDGRRIDVHAKYLDPGGQQVADRHRVQRGGHPQAEVHVAKLNPHLPLGFEHGGNDLGQGSVVANAASQQEFHVVLDAFVHDAAGDHALFHGFADAAEPPHAVDRAEVVFVAGFGQAAVIEMHSEAG